MDASKDILIQQQANKIEQLEQELRIVQRQLQQFQGRQMNDIAARRRAAMQYYREQYMMKHPNETPVVLTSDSSDDVIDSMGNDGC